MNNIIYITGAPRCGKTTLANVLADENTSILSLDAFSKSIRYVFPDFKLYSKAVLISPDMNKDKFLQIVYEYAYHFHKDFPNHKLIIEGCHFSPDEFKNKFQSCKIICLGRTKSIGSIKEAIVTKDWMARLDADKIEEYANLIYAYSEKLKNSNYTYFQADDINDIKNKLEMR